jgi:copper transport protein
MLKTAAVALAASLGAYNHVRLRPALAAAPEDTAVRATLRSVLTAEAILLTFVAIVTCWLVAAAT